MLSLRLQYSTPHFLKYSKPELYLSLITWFRYSHPKSSSLYEDVEWAALLELSRDDAKHSSLPVSLLPPPLCPDTHQFQVGMWLEVVHPLEPYSVHVGKISEVIDAQYFRISVESDIAEDYSWITCINDPLILPCGFCKKHNLDVEPPKDWKSEGQFDWDIYPSSSLSLCAQDRMFPKIDSSENLGFMIGHKLEAVNPLAPNNICAATIKQTCGHLLLIQLDSELNSTPVILASTSQDIFPTGWCLANNYPLQLPAEYSSRTKSLDTSLMVSLPMT